MTDDLEIFMAARRLHLRARHRVLERRAGRDVALSPAENTAIRRAVLAGEALPAVAMRYGLSKRRIMGVVARLCPDLLERPCFRERARTTTRTCERCGAQFEATDWRRRFCSQPCANAATLAKRVEARRQNHRARRLACATGENPHDTSQSTSSADHDHETLI